MNPIMLNTCYQGNFVSEDSTAMSGFSRRTVTRVKPLCEAKLYTTAVGPFSRRTEDKK